MKLNIMMYVNNMTEQLVEYKASIKNAETYDEAKKYASRMLGYIDCGITFMNTMIGPDNNDFTGDLDDLLTSWQARVYNELGNKAIDTKQDSELICKLLKARDELMATIG